MNRKLRLGGLEDSFNEDLYSQILDVPNVVAKSLYDFDLSSVDGVLKLLNLLPVMDPDILEDILRYIWPGYSPEDTDPGMMRAEIKGFLLDYLADSE